MRTILTPKRDSHNSTPTEQSSGVSFSAKYDPDVDLDEEPVDVVELTFPDGRVLAFDADELGRTLNALGVCL